MMPVISKKVTSMLFMLVLYAGATMAQTGKIAGTITDKDTDEPLIGATVLIVGSSQGAASDFDGNYNILNVKPGTYSLRISYVGYSSQLVSNVKVSIGLTTKIDVGLSSEILALGEEITIVAERPLVQKDLTASTSIVSGDEISELPVTELSEVVSLQAGNVDGHFRGGRTGEVAYWIDGVPVTDKFNGSSVVDLNTNIVSELQVISGAFNAEYGQAMSAIINVATKDGSNDFRGSLSTYFGDYLTGNDDLFLKPSTFNPLNIQNYDLSINGPIIKDNLFFFATARYVDFGGWLYGKRKFNPDNFQYTDTLTNELGFSSPGDGKIVPMNNSSKINLQTKLTWPITTTIKAAANMIYETREYKDYNRSRVYNPDGVGTNYQDSYTFIGSLTHTLSASTFYTLSFTGFNKFFEYYLYDGLSDKYVHPTLNTTLGSFVFSTGGQDMGQYTRELFTYGFKADLWSQVNNEHQIKTGIEFKYHDLFEKSATVLPGLAEENFSAVQGADPSITPRYESINSLSFDYYQRNPMEFAVYVQDKIEFDNFILNIGVRFDWFDAASTILSDPTDPNIYNPLKPINNYNDLNGNGLIDNAEITDGNRKSLADRKKYWYKDTEPDFQISPRLGAAFPITDQGKIYFSYGHFFQFPNFDLLYRNANYKFSTQSGNVGVAGNSALKAESNISMEVGLNQQITDNAAIDATVYFRDYRDLSGTTSSEIVMFGGTRSYSQIINADFAFVRGFIFSYSQRIAQGLSVNLDYTYQIAKGTASDPDQARNATAGGQLPEIKLANLAWDQTNTINATVNYNADKWGVSSILNFGSGLPYTPRQTQDVSIILLNSEKKPTTVNMDVRTYYNIDLPVGGMTVFARIYNLFDTKNQLTVFNDSGVADYTTDQQRAESLNPNLFGVNTLDEYYTNPQWYSEPRRIEIGVTYNF